MQPLRAVRTRLSTRPDSEHEQALLRIVIVGLVLAYMAVFHGWRNNWTSLDVQIVQVLSGFLVLAIAIFVAICTSPDANVPRRLVGMLADAGGCTWYMWVAGEYGFFVIGIYLFITFGNGFRYGRRYLFGCQALCLIGLTSVIAFVPYWVERRVAGVGLLIALVVLPLYVSTLLKRIQEARAKAEEANSAKTTFLANMSHEIRTPLNGIVGVVDLFRTTELTPQQAELVKLLRHSVTVLRSLVDDVLDISKIESGRLTIEVSDFDLYATVNGLVQLLRPHASSKGLELNATVDPELDYRLRGDSHHLRQVLLNLLGNAIKFTERGEVNLSVKLLKATEQGVTARFEVRDTGIGIAEALLPKIFERFVQADQSATRKFGGSGLGTTIAKQLVELMGGTIGVASRLGEGTTFWFEVPFLRQVTDVPSPTFDYAANGDSHSILVAEGETARALITVLRSAGENPLVISPADPLGPKIDSLAAAGANINAVVVSSTTDVACRAFASARQRLGDTPLALIFIAREQLSVLDSARLKSIRDAVVLDANATARVIANAIHAAIASSNKETSESIDLGRLVQQERVRLHVLVADDNRTNQAILSQLLTSAGHTVLMASDGEEALDIYERERPDMALLDFNMPLRNGFEVVRAIRMMEDPPARMPAVILSASVTPEARKTALESGADDFIGKPFDAVALLSKVDKLALRVPEGHRVRNPQVFKADVRDEQEPASRMAIRRPDGELLDYERVKEIEEISRDPTFTLELFRGFKSDVELLLDRLDAAAAGGDIASIGDALHALKGAAVGIGASSLSLVCDQASPAARNDKSIMTDLASRLRHVASDTFAELDEYAKNQQRISHH